MPSGRVLGASERSVSWATWWVWYMGVCAVFLYMVKDITTLIVKESSGFSY